MQLLHQLLTLQGKIDLPFAGQSNSSPIKMFLRSASDQKKGLDLLRGNR